MPKPIDGERLIKLMGMTTSSSDGEALNAIRLANALVVGAGHTWEEVLRGRVGNSGPGAAAMREHAARQPRHGQFSSDAYIDSMFETLLRTTRGGFRAFVASAHEFYEKNGYLTVPQQEAIVKAFERANSRENKR